MRRRSNIRFAIDGGAARAADAMLFHSSDFFFFFWIVFAVYWSLPKLQWRNGWLVAASCVFYGTWNPWLISLILFTASVDYVVALRLMVTTSPTMRRALLALSIGVSLSLLIFFNMLIPLTQVRAWISGKRDFVCSPGPARFGMPPSANSCG